MSRIIALAPQRKAVLGALDRVAESPVFHSSKRGREFLRHIVERALAGEFEQLKERCIGSALFGRPGDYDTGSDSVVRVTANDVRKRLAAYYDAAGNAEPVTFELPVGSYIPEIHLAPTLDRPPAAPVEPLAAPVVARSRWSAIAGWLVAAVLGLVLLRGWMLKPESPQSRAIATLPWLAMFDGGKTPRLILADSSMGALRELHPFPASVEDYANRKFLTPPTGLRPDLTGVWNSIATRRHTSMASARVAAEFSPLALAAGRSPVILGAREVNLGDFHRGENFILVGGSSSTPWVELFEDQMDFDSSSARGRPVRSAQLRPHRNHGSGLCYSLVAARSRRPRARARNPGHQHGRHRPGRRPRAEYRSDGKPDARLRSGPHKGLRELRDSAEAECHGRVRQFFHRNRHPLHALTTEVINGGTVIKAELNKARGP
jgi:hypothetical protein